MNTRTPLSRTLSTTRRMLLALALPVMATLMGCGGSDDVDRGPTQINITAQLNGLYWDAGEGALYLTDDATNTIRKWDGKQAFPTHAPLTAAPASGAALGQLARTGDGSFYTPRFGFGTDGTIVAVRPSGAAVNLAGLDTLRRRIGLVVGGSSAAPEIIDNWFIKGSTGGVSRITLNGDTATETSLVTGLTKPTGLAVAGDVLYVSDQATGALLSFSLPAARAQAQAATAGTVVALFTAAEGLDLMTAAPDGTLFFGTSAGTLYQVAPNGTKKVLASGWGKLRGVAYDAAHRRLFVAERPLDSTLPSAIRIVPID